MTTRRLGDAGPFPGPAEGPGSAEVIPGGGSPVLAAPSTLVPSTLQHRGDEYYQSEVIQAATLAPGLGAHITYTIAPERLQVVQTTVGVILAVGFDREPSANDFDHLIASAIYWDFQVRSGIRDLYLLNISGVAPTQAIPVVAMAGARFRMGG